MSAITSTLYWAVANNTLYISAESIGGTLSGSFSATTKFSYATPSPWNDYYLDIHTVEILTPVSPQYIQGWFGAHINDLGRQDGSWIHEIIGLEKIDTSNITDMIKVFSLLNKADPVNDNMVIDLNSWDVSNVDTTTYMFYAANVTILFDQWTTYNLAYASYMFSGYTNPQSYLDVHCLYFDALANATRMFSDCECRVIDIRGMKITSDVDYNYMFQNAETQTIYSSENWDLSDTSDRMFSGCSILSGAIAYDSTKTSGYYANYLTGYFTYKELTQENKTSQNLSITNLIDTELRQLDINVAVLDYNFHTVDEISGLTTSVSFSIDADSDIRRIANIGMVLHSTKSNLDYWTAGNPYWFDKYIKIQTGIKNKDYYALDNVDEYANDATYHVGDVVRYDGGIYRCKDTTRMAVNLIDHNSATLLTTDGETLQCCSGTSESISGVPPFNITVWTKLEEYEWVNQGVYMINAPSITYNATDNTLSFQAVDLMSKLTGMRNGYLEGMTYQITAGQNIVSVIKDLLEEQGFTKMLLTAPSGNETTTTPIDISIDIGSTAYDLLTQLRDINPNWEMFFDVDGVFRFQPIPSGNDVTPEFSDEVWDAVMTGYSLDTSFEDVKNYVEVVGKQIEPDETATVSHTSGSTSVTITLSRTFSSYVSSSSSSNVVWYIGFTMGDWTLDPTEFANPITTIVVKDSSSATQTITIPTDSQAIYYDNESYFVRLTFDDSGYVEGAFAGYLQPRAIAFDNDPTSPFYVGQYTINNVTHEAYELTSPTTLIHSMPKFNKMVRGVFSGDDYDNIYTNNLAYQRAKYELYLNCRLHDTIAIDCIPLYWLDVNKVISFTPKGESEASKWIIKSISTDVSVSGVQSVSAMRYYALYNS